MTVGCTFSLPCDDKKQIYTPEELKGGQRMLQRIIDDLKKEAITYILPMNNVELLQNMIAPFNELMAEGKTF